MLNMFMNPISRVNNLQIADYDQSGSPMRSNQRILFNDLSNFERNSLPEDLKNQALPSLTASCVPKWEVVVDSVPTVIKHSPSELQIEWPHLECGAPSNYHRIPLNCAVESDTYLEKRNQSLGRSNSCEPSSACSISHSNETTLLGPTATMSYETGVIPEEFESNFGHSFKRRMHLDPHLSPSYNKKSSRISNSTSSTSPSPIENLNFDALNDPTDETMAHPCHEASPVSSSFRYLTSSDDFFVVQTPSKAINESDQQSFHLSSPPSGFGNLGGTANTKSVKSFRPRVLFRNSNFESEKPVSSSLIKGLGAPLKNQSPKPRFSFVGPLNQPKSSASDSIALSMAKMTVWNRMAAAATPVTIVKTPQSATNVPRLGLSGSRQAISAPGVRLAYPVHKEPEFTIRRILQMACGKKWRRFALGENEHCENAVQMAHLFLNTRSTDLY